MAQAYGFMAQQAKPKPQQPQRQNRVGTAAMMPQQDSGPRTMEMMPRASAAPAQGTRPTATPNMMPGTLNASGAQPGGWTPQFSREPGLQQPGQPLSGSPLPSITGPGYGSLYNIDTYANKDTAQGRFIDNVLPLRQQLQNEYQYQQDYNEAQRRWDTEMRWNKARDQYNMDVTGRQQQMAEWQAQQAANQWQSQFGHTQAMDIRGMGQRDTELANQLKMGMDQNQASRDVAGTYAGAQRYGADKEAMASMYGADKQLAGAGLYANAQRYGSDQERIAAMYGADQQLAGANVYAGAQRYGSDREFDATKYQWDMQNRINQAMMLNNLQVANTQAYGRAERPAANWASNWA